MELKNLPTDNIYKFFSIFGLLLIFAGVTLILNNNLENLKNINANYLKENRLIREREKSFFNLLYYKNRKSDLRRFFNYKYGNYPFDTTKIFNQFKKKLDLNPEILKDREKYYKLQIQVQNSHSKFNEIKTLISINKKELDFFNTQFFTKKVMSISIVIIGITLSFFGFFKWYKQTQKLVDIQLLNNSFSSEISDRILHSLDLFYQIYYLNHRKINYINSKNIDDLLDEINCNFEDNIKFIEEFQLKYSSIYKVSIIEDFERLKFLLQKANHFFINKEVIKSRIYIKQYLLSLEKLHRDIKNYYGNIIK